MPGRCSCCCTHATSLIQPLSQATILHLATSPVLQLSNQLALLFRSWMGERLANSSGLVFHQGGVNVMYKRFRVSLATCWGCWCGNRACLYTQFVPVWPYTPSTVVSSLQYLVLWILPTANSIISKRWEISAESEIPMHMHIEYA